MVGWFLAARAATWTVDPSGFDARSAEPDRCPAAATATLDGRPLTTLGVAVVVYSRKQGTMAWGHASLRARFCVDGVSTDREYESYRLGSWNEQMLRYEHAGEPFLDDPDYLRSQRGALVLFRNPDPATAGWYADAQRHNREIYESWLPLDQAALDAVVVAAESWYAAQLATFRARGPLPERYAATTTNCTAVLKRTLPEEVWVPSALPFAWLRALEQRPGERVLYPSIHLWRRWDGEPPDRVERPHPVFRGRSG